VVKVLKTFAQKKKKREKKLTLNRNPLHIGAFDFKNELKCSKVLRAKLALNFNPSLMTQQ
jgi:hypothetical protein